MMTETTLMALKGKEQKEQKRLYDASHVTQSGEDYLETILMLQKKKGMVRSADLARHMGFSKTEYMPCSQSPKARWISDNGR